MSRLDSYLAQPRMTEPRYWYRHQDQPWFKLLKNQLRCSTSTLAGKLAETAREYRGAADAEAVVAYFKKHYSLEREKRWRKPSQWDYPYTSLRDLI